MHWFYSAIRYYPWIALPGALILGSVGVHFRRRKKSLQWSFFGLAGMLALLTVRWFVFRGDLYANPWLQTLQGRDL